MPDDTLNTLRDPHAAEPEAPPAAPVIHEVEVYDPELPGAPRTILAANFDPHRYAHWAHRPAVAELDLGSIKAPGGDEPLLAEPQVRALTAKGLTTVKAILRAGLRGLSEVPGVSTGTAEQLYGWTMGRAAARHALAELEAEGPRVEAVQARADAYEGRQYVPPGPPHTGSVPGEFRPLFDGPADAEDQTEDLEDTGHDEEDAAT